MAFEYRNALVLYRFYKYQYRFGKKQRCAEFELVNRRRRTWDDYRRI